MWFAQINLISGFMVGIEVQWGEGITILDLGIVRIILTKGDVNDDTYP